MLFSIVASFCKKNDAGHVFIYMYNNIVRLFVKHFCENN